MNAKCMTEKGKQFDLEERIARFAENLIAFLKTLKETTLNKPLISQLIRSGTSIGKRFSA